MKYSLSLLLLVVAACGDDLQADFTSPRTPNDPANKKP
jgi:hypothetical protein